MFGFVSKKELEKREQEKEIEKIKQEKKETEKSKKIKEIANYFILNNINITDVVNAYQFIQEYESKIKEFNKTKRNTITKSNYSSAPGDSLLFGLIGLALDGAEELSNKSKESKIEKDKNDFIENNKEMYQKCTAFINLLPKDSEYYCAKYGAKIINEINSILQQAEEFKKEQERLTVEKQKQEERIKIEQKKQEQKEEIKAVEENRKAENELSANKQKEELCSKSIKEIEGLTLVFQKFISENKKINFEHLNMLEGFLDKIVYLKSFISELDINTVNRCQKKLLASLALCENKNEIQADIDIITEGFEKILG